MEIYRRSEFVGAGITGVFVQDNYSRSIQRVLRSSEFPQRAHQRTILPMHSLRITEPVRRCLRLWTEALRAYLAEREAVAGIEEPR